MSKEAYIEGFALTDLDHLKKKWLDCATITLKFNRYMRFTYFYHILILAITVYCWFSLTYLFFSFNHTDIVECGIFSIIFRRIPFTNAGQPYLRAPREARMVREGRPMNQVKNATNDACGLGHLVVGDVDPGVSSLVDKLIK